MKTKFYLIMIQKCDNSPIAFKYIGQSATQIPEEDTQALREHYSNGQWGVAIRATKGMFGVGAESIFQAGPFGRREEAEKAALEYATAYGIQLLSPGALAKLDEYKESDELTASDYLSLPVPTKAEEGEQ